MACSICGAEADLILLRGGPEGSSGESLCARCARERGIRTRGGGIEIGFEELLALPGAELRDPGPCPRCGAELSRLRRSGLLGCSSCVERFRKELRRRLGGRGGPGPSPRAKDRRPEPAPILESRLRLGRMLPELPLPGLAAGERPAGPLLRPRLEAAGLEVKELGELDGAALGRVAALLPPPSWLEAEGSLVVFLGAESPLCLLDCVDHLSLRGRRPGLALAELEEELGAAASRLDALAEPARDPEFGLLCARVGEIGEGRGAELLLHLPALERRGDLDRLLRQVLAEGWSLEGRYGSERGSAGSLWVLGAGEGRAPSLGELGETGLRLAEAEERARAELLASSREELLDLAARAFGLLSWARSLGLGEALEALSDLRLGALAGLLPDFETAALGPLLVSLAGAAPPRGRTARDDAERARRLRSIFGLGEPFVSPGPFLRTEGGR